jgi:hypothetical protein
MLRVIAKCNNQEFNDLDEYVFSVRSNERFEYFEEVRFKIRKRERAQIKVAVKIPPVRENYVIEGFLEVQLESLTPVSLPIYAKCEVPQILCIKDLFKSDEDTPVIKIPAKKNQIRMPPIPFKNLSNFNFTLEVEAISNESFSGRPYDIITQNFVNCQANTQFFVNLQLKENMSYKGTMPAKDFIRKILVLKIKGSSIYYNYPIEVYVFESTNSNGMS